MQFSYLRVGNVETHSVNNGTDTEIKLVYEIPEKLVSILGLSKADVVDMTSEKEAHPCHNKGHITIPASRFQMHWQTF